MAGGASVPTYQYACTSCDEQFERVQSFSDPSLTVHEPGCGGPVRKVFGSVGVVFKGSGFYRNDSRSGSTSSEAKSSDSKPAETKTSEAPAAKKAESKPAASSTPSSSGSTAAA
jgi:putative FmdB family regulatory protein